MFGNGTAVGTSITLANSGDQGYFVAYDNGDAYIYEADSGANASVASTEITLVAILDGVATDALTAGDFVV
jgi:hypothetical protein